jgi:glycosyltransferase involved in cell wall biosynthesis
VASTASCLPEVAGDAALLVPPTDVDALAVALDTAISDESVRAELLGRAPARLALFSWEKSARQLLGTYQSLCA